MAAAVGKWPRLEGRPAEVGGQSYTHVYRYMFHPFFSTAGVVLLERSQPNVSVFHPKCKLSSLMPRKMREENRYHVCVYIYVYIHT